MSDPESKDGVYVILGATGGIGSAVSRLLSSRESRLVLASRDEERLAGLAGEIGGETYPLDATRPDEVEACAKRAVEVYGRLDGIANCVGSVFLKPAHITREEEWAQTMSVNLGSAFGAVRAAGKVMRSGGSVVLMSSAAARIGLANHEAIAAAKAGILGLMLSAAATYGSKGLRFNAVAPGLVETPATERITGNEAARNASLSLHALGALGKPSDVAPVIAWLLGPESGWVTGQVFGVDGGLATVRTRAG
jgi:NAD(P)-dependent dehydrogenase (short-subunit alcohol dehydrogenase family)